MSDPIKTFEATYGFAFDDFQRRGCRALAEGSSVVIAAPTGAGKTVVGEFAVWLALRRGGKAFYTTPIKALSNQKYGDLSAIHGPSNVGLLTGDNSLNGDAPVVVMTTEVLRNMLYQDSPELADLRFVILDEVHYLQDRYRGAVWEEILIHLPVDVRVVCLSATVSNAEEFGEWVATLRGDTEVIIEEQRPVELRHWYMASDELLPMFVRRDGGEPVPNPRAAELERRRRRGPRPQRGSRRMRERRARIPYRYEVVDRLQAEDMLPAIYFIFSRKGCDAAVAQCLDANLRLTNADERALIVQYADLRTADLSPAELEVLGYDAFVSGLAAGIAAHHAGMIPPFKETVEELFARGLIKVVFATETLALGINMPARTVVIESLMKFNGESHELMTPGEYTQLSGRAGRRGIDEVGHSVVLLQRYTRFDTVARLATARSYPLRSSFQVSYNMAVNLVRNYDPEEAEHLVNSSFAQFQADQEVVHLENLRERQTAYLASYRERARCELGDIDGYLELKRRLERKKRGAGAGITAPVSDAISALRPGDVIVAGAGKRRGRYAVVEVSQRRSERRPRVLALSEERTMVRLGPHDFGAPPLPIGRVRLPHGFDVRDAASRRQLARRLAAFDAPVRATERGDGTEIDRLQARLESHPCHKCPELERHIHHAERAQRLERELASLERRINSRSGTLARSFERVLDVLRELHHVEGWSLTHRGEMLTRVYNEADLLVVEALERGLLAGLDVPDLAAVCSTFVYETRGPEPAAPPRLPTGASEAAFGAVMRLWRDIHERELSRGLDLTRVPDAGFAARAYDWAAGADLDVVVGDDDAPGDFVRAVKQLVDLLQQMQEVAADPGLAARLRDAAGALNRGVVAYSSLEP